MKLTREIIHSAGKSYVGFNYDQLKLMGVHYPPSRGWIDRLIGTEIPDETWVKILDLKGLPGKHRRRLRKGLPMKPDLLDDFRGVR